MAMDINKIPEQMALVLPTLRGQLRWFDGYSKISKEMQSTATPYGLMSWMGIMELPKDTSKGNDAVMRVPFKNDYRLLSVLAPGADADMCNMWQAFTHACARELGAVHPHPQELTNTLLTTYPISALTADGFRTREGVILTLYWPYLGQR